MCDKTLESTDGAWTLSDIKTNVKATQDNDFYTDLEQVFSTSKVKVFDENDDHLTTLTQDLLSDEIAILV